MELSLRAVNLLKYVLSSTGEKQVNEKGAEVDVPRRLNGEESAQRRFFFGAVKEFVDKSAEEVNAEIVKYNEFLDKKRADLGEAEKKDEVLQKNEELKEAMKELQEFIAEVNMRKVSFELKDKTVKSLKKYFVEYGGEVGFMAGDDEIVEEIEKQLS